MLWSPLLIKKIILNYLSKIYENMKKLLDILLRVSVERKKTVSIITLLSFLAISCLIISCSRGLLDFRLWLKSHPVAADTLQNTVVPFPETLNTSYMSADSLLSAINLLLLEQNISSEQVQLFTMNLEQLNRSLVIIEESLKNEELSLNPTQRWYIEIIKEQLIITRNTLLETSQEILISNNRNNSSLNAYSIEDLKSSYAWVPAAIAAAGSIFGGISAGSAQSSANQTNLTIARETNQANAALAQQQQNWNIDLWNMENEYNTPAAQMQRYRDAGLNPNLIYGSGSASAGNASSVNTVAPVQMQRAQVQPVNYFQGVAQGLSQGISALLQSKQIEVNQQRADSDLIRTGSNVDLNQARITLLEAQALSERMKPELIATQIAKNNVDIISSSIEAEIRRNFRDISADYYSNQVKAQALAMKLNEAQIDKLSNDIYVAVQRLGVEFKRLQLSESQIVASINYMNKGGTLRELQAEYMRKGLPYYDAEKIVGIIGSAVGSVATVGTAAAKMSK